MANKNRNNRIRIAIQKSGRLNAASLEFLSSLGLQFRSNGRALIQPCLTYPLDLLLLRDDDIPEYVQGGVADFGVVGNNVLKEQQAQVRILRTLGFGRCRLDIAVPREGRLREVMDLEGERIATTYPRLLKAYLRKQGISAAVIPLTGSVEIAPELNLSDAICDIVQTGKTLEVHGLVPLETVLESEAVLIVAPGLRKERALFTNLFFS